MIKNMYSMLPLLCLFSITFCAEQEEKPQKKIRKKKPTPTHNNLNNNVQKTLPYIPIKDFARALGIPPSLYVDPTK